MTILSASRSQPVDPGFAVAATLVALTLFLFGWGLLHRGFFRHHPIVDTPVYLNYGRAMDDGRVPYRDFRLEYKFQRDFSNDPTIRFSDHIVAATVAARF